MSRSVSWRRIRTKDVAARIEESLRYTLFLLNEVGPTGFVVKQDGCDRKFKVFLGDPHSCTCSQFKKEKELCIHILWLLLKKFKVSKENPLVFQLGLVEREIQEILSGHLKFQSPKRQSEDSSVPQSASCDQRPITGDDLCPICQESLTTKPQRLSYCKYGCGNNVHLRCIKMWAEHQKTQGETLITCPLCREKFSTFKELYDELHSKGKRPARIGREVLHLGVTCDNCRVCPISGKCYKCDTCLNYFLCSDCFKTNNHKKHSFLFRQHPSHTWKSAPSRLATVLPSQNLIDDLQNRDLTDNDYELLLHLDASHNLSIEAPSSNFPANKQVLNSLHAEPLDHTHWLIVSQRTCSLCCEQYKRGDWIRRLPCKHRFHRQCIDDHLVNDPSGTMSCPIDGKLVHTSNQERSGCRRTRKHSDTRNRKPERVLDNPPISITGQGLEVNGRRWSITDERDTIATPTLGNSTPSIKRGLTIGVNTRIGSGIRNGNEPNGMELSLQAVPISACSNASEHEERMSRLSLPHSAKTIVAKPTNPPDTDNLQRRNSQQVVVTGLTTNHRRHHQEKAGPSRDNEGEGFPSIHPPHKSVRSVLCVGPANRHERLPPINAHLKQPSTDHNCN